MLAVAAASRNLLRHVIRAPEIYLLPRSDGRILIGATVEEAGFDKRTDPDAIQRMHQAAIRLVPALSQARMLEAWAGLRPGSPDNLPILGESQTPGYFVATGHFRDGILLAPGDCARHGASDQRRRFRLRSFAVFTATFRHSLITDS